MEVCHLKIILINYDILICDSSICVQFLEAYSVYLDLNITCKNLIHFVYIHINKMSNLKPGVNLKRGVNKVVIRLELLSFVSFLPCCCCFLFSLFALPFSFICFNFILVSFFFACFLGLLSLPIFLDFFLLLYIYFWIRFFFFVFSRTF